MVWTYLRGRVTHNQMYPSIEALLEAVENVFCQLDHQRAEALSPCPMPDSLYRRISRCDADIMMSTGTIPISFPIVAYLPPPAAALDTRLPALAPLTWILPCAAVLPSLPPRRPMP